MATKKKSKNKKNTKNSAAVQTAKKENKQSVNQLTAVLWFVFSLFFMAVAVYEGGKSWRSLHDFTYSIFGIGSFIIPIYIMAMVVYYSLDKLNGNVKKKFLQLALLIYFVIVAADVFGTRMIAPSYSEHLSVVYAAETWRGGGVLGALLGGLLSVNLEYTGAVIVVVILLFASLMILTGTTIAKLFRGAGKPVVVVGKKAKEVVEERKKQIDFEVEDAVEPEKFVLNEKQKRVVDACVNGQSDELPPDDEIPLPEEAPPVSVDIEYDEPEEIIEPPVEKIKLTAEETAAEIQNIAEEIEETMVVTEEETYEFPPISLLNSPKGENGGSVKAELESTATKLVEVLKSFGVETKIMDVSRGPTVTRYELQPCAGVKISKITNLADDIALNLAAAGVRIEAPIPNKAAVGIEVPNKVCNTVSVKEIIESEAFTNSKSKLTVAMGKDIAGNPIVTDIAKMPHGLIAGQTGSGKSVCINSIIMSILYKASPEEVKMLMIDPKVVELGIYNGIPHLLVPVVTDPRKASGALGWAVTEMERRYRLFADNNVRDLVGFNRLCELDCELQKLPQVVIIIDELADLMMTAPGEVEDSINRIAAKARAAGMHLLIATQRPSVDVVTGVIKANVPTRIAFAVASQIDSRTILDIGGAEKLLGRGDMLFNPVGASKPARLQGCFVSDEEVEKVVDFVKGNRSHEYSEEIQGEIDRLAASQKKGKNNSAADEDADDGDEDALLMDAIQIVVEVGQASTSFLQRKLKLGYGRASRIIDQMEARGIIGPYEGSKPRQVLITAAEWMEKQARDE